MSFIDRLNEARAAHGHPPLSVSEPTPHKPAKAPQPLAVAVFFTWLTGFLVWLCYNYLTPCWHGTPLSLLQGAAAWFIFLAFRRMLLK